VPVHEVETGSAWAAAFGADALELHYQPVADGAGRIVGLEALMRWHHRRRGSISPEAFIPIFERSGLIGPVSRWALARACGDAVAWPRPLQVAVNLSAMQFDSGDLPDIVGAVLGRSGLAPARLELEVTEAALARDAGGVARTIRRLRALGVAVALADFGTGRSGPSYLKDFAFSRLKLARSLVAELEHSASARSIVHMLIALGHSLGLAVAADAVETPGQLAFLAAEGCDRVQGFLIGRPGPIHLHAALTGRNASSLPPPPPQAAAPASRLATATG
jgi:EAL domain-containing protein (putative c-di-GMP-specific phosphodiesterase class I)